VAIAGRTGCRHRLQKPAKVLRPDCGPESHERRHGAPGVPRTEYGEPARASCTLLDGWENSVRGAAASDPDAGESGQDIRRRYAGLPARSHALNWIQSPA